MTIIKLRIAEYVTRVAWKNFRVLKIRTLSAPQNMFNAFVIMTLDLFIIFYWKFHNIVESRSIQQINIKTFQNFKTKLVIYSEFWPGKPLFLLFLIEIIS